MRKPSGLGVVLATMGPRRDQQRLHRLSLTEILSELDERPDPARPVYGFQVKVGTERNPFWLHRSGDHYEVTDTRPLEPPFITESDARLARIWLIQTVPDVATLCEPVYSPAPLAARAAAPLTP